MKTSEKTKHRKKAKLQKIRKEIASLKNDIALFTKYKKVFSVESCKEQLQYFQSLLPKTPINPQDITDDFI